MHRVVKERFTDLSYLLGGWQPCKDRNSKVINGKKEKWTPRIEVVKATIEFVKSTERFVEEIG